MSYYFVARIKIKDETEYRKYLDEAGVIFEKYSGVYLSVDDQPEVLEGSWNHTRMVIIEFKDKKEFESWYHSIDYQRILKHRLAAADCDTVLVKGLS